MLRLERHSFGGKGLDLDGEVRELRQDDDLWA